MPRFTLSTVVAVAILSSKVYAQTDTTSALVPLASKHFDYNNLPYQADPDNGVRGTQFGYNRCNSTTENQQSLCQTAIINTIDDFCLWGPPKGPETIGDTEGEEVAWCSKAGHGSRLFSAGTLQGVQFMTTPDYVQVVGFIDQTQINIAATDFGGELDPHGADFRGNPLGGLVYSTAFSSNGTGTAAYTQVIEWHNFMGGSVFCFKICNPAGANAANFCQHIYDRIGCAYNAPNNAKNGTFESCQGDSQDYPGIYTDAAGVVQTYTQPAESLGAISTMPYQPKVPASSNCVTYTSSVIYAALPTPTNAVSSSPSGTSVRSSGSKSSSGSGPANTGSSSSGASGNAGSPTGLALTTLTSLFGVCLAIFILS
jgi:hypothetical protein